MMFCIITTRFLSFSFFLSSFFTFLFAGLLFLLVLLLLLLTIFCGLCDVSAVVREEESLLDPIDQQSLLDPRQVTENCPHYL